MHALFVKNLFCPDNTWQVCHVGTEDECWQGKRDAAAQGVRAVYYPVKNCQLWDHVAGDKSGPIYGDVYQVIKRKAV